MIVFVNLPLYGRELVGDFGGEDGTKFLANLLLRLVFLHLRKDARSASGDLRV